ncbi:MAG: tripartite tricarboxylate transporter substrate-binding protein, partial [Betaproteobacteria bacterium]
MTPLATLAQAWPTKQAIKLVAVFPPGGSVDQVARLLAPALSQQLGQSVLVENKGSASASIGAAAVAAAASDGYTFAVVFDSHGVNPSLIPGLPFDSKKDLSPAVLIGTPPDVLARMNEALNKAMKTPELAKRLDARALMWWAARPKRRVCSSSARWTSGARWSRTTTLRPTDAGARRFSGLGRDAQRHQKAGHHVVGGDRAGQF